MTARKRRSKGYCLAFQVRFPPSRLSFFHSWAVSKTATSVDFSQCLNHSWTFDWLGLSKPDRSVAATGRVEFMCSIVPGCLRVSRARSGTFRVIQQLFTWQLQNSPGLICIQRPKHLRGQNRRLRRSPDKIFVYSVLPSAVLASASGARWRGKWFW